MYSSDDGIEKLLCPCHHQGNSTMRIPLPSLHASAPLDAYRHTVPLLVPGRFSLQNQIAIVNKVNGIANAQ
jgi:hypothetical protein